MADVDVQVVETPLPESSLGMFNSTVQEVLWAGWTEPTIEVEPLPDPTVGGGVE